MNQDNRTALARAKAKSQALRADLAEAMTALRKIDKLHSCILSRAPEHRPEPLCAGCVARNAFKRIKHHPPPEGSEKK